MSESASSGLRPIIDGITVTIPVDIKREPFLRKRIMQLEKDVFALPDGYSVKRGTPRQQLHYHQAAELRLQEGMPSEPANDSFATWLKPKKKPADALMQVAPVSLSANFCRVELNPARLGPARTAELIGRINEILAYGETSFASGKVTGIDIAIDLPGIQPDRYHWERSPQSKRIVFGSGGAVETIYVGKTRGANLCVYARDAKLQEGEKICRIERRIKPGIPVTCLTALENPLKDVKAYDLDLLVPLLPKQSLPWFKMAAASTGFRGAIKHLPEAAQERLKDALAGAVLEWWKPEVIWAQWPTCMKEAFGSNLEVFGEQQVFDTEQSTVAA